jgi:hypothetical protein
MQWFPVWRLSCAFLVLMALPASFPQAYSASTAAAAKAVPANEKLFYSIEWRLIYAGDARLDINQLRASEWETKLHLESGGLVSKLYKLDDNYRVELQEGYCATSSRFDAIEGSRHHQTDVTFDRVAHKATYLERDLLKNAVLKRAETEIPACVSDIIGGFYKLRTIPLQPGQSTTVPISDGKKSVAARVEAKEREEVTTKAGKFKTVRLEAFVFNGVLYKKNAKLEIWLTDDDRRLPVQLRARMPFPIGTITFQLDKEERI